MRSRYEIGFVQGGGLTSVHIIIYTHVVTVHASIQQLLIYDKNYKVDNNEIWKILRPKERIVNIFSIQLEIKSMHTMIIRVGSLIVF